LTITTKDLNHLCKAFPALLLSFSLVTPKLTDDLGDFWIPKTRMLRNDAGVVVLTIEYEG